ncbi:flagellar FlbD family protein [Halanaerobaculum tunisiense]
MIIKLSRLNDSELVVNAELIKTVEATPDTVITLTTDQKLIVKETVDEVIAKVVAYKRRIQVKPE